MNQPNPPQLFTEKQVAKALQISPATLRTWRCRQQGPRFVKIGGKAVRYEYRDILTFVNGEPDDVEEEVPRPDEW